MGKQLVFKFIISGLIKYFLINSDFQKSIADRIEISTPLNSWKRVTEAIFLTEHGIDPYQGDMFHETPLNLSLYIFITKTFKDYINIIFILIDQITAILLYFVAKKVLNDWWSLEQKEKYNEKSKFLTLTKSSISNVPSYVMTAFLFNPFIILNCVAKTTTTFTNLYLAIAYFGIVFKIPAFSFFGLASATCKDFYPFVLIFPTSFYLVKDIESRNGKIITILGTIFTYSLCLYLMLYTSFHIYGDWSFLTNVYGIILKITDLKPNIGIAWYFFTEMFDHFHLLFIFAFQINVTILYLAPLSIRFFDNPILVAVCLNALTVMFRSYPCVGDVGFYLSLYLLWNHLFGLMQQTFIICCFLLISSVLAPVFWHLWIYSGAANANFYFGVTLAFAVAQIFLLTDLLFAYVKRDYFLKNGFSKKVQLIFD